ncbi:MULTISPECIES: ATP-binding protein [Bacillus]|uniref:ATP-binding protein n=1 Tax=Bacillus TaxID=1386 RepID=UPI002E1EB15E|nr:ATP-binding protein [Bacillus smithii]MED4928158.1 ATP-binding protein [Bacillus smithii]
MRKIIFVGGIHGVGKSYFCNQLKQKYSIQHFSCSSLISEFKKSQFKKKEVKDVQTNQSILINALSSITFNDNPFLLDGHFCLLTPEQEVTQIPLNTFLAISPQTIIVLKDDPEKIYSRLIQRDRVKYDILLLQKMQNIELNYSKFVSQKLSVPYFVYDVSNPDKSINDYIDNLFVRQKTEQ